MAKKILERTSQKIMRRIKCIYYFGFKFKCPICGHRFRKLLSYGLKPRMNAQCPFCLSLERHRLLWLYLKNKTNFFTDQLNVFHIAPEAVFSQIFKSMPNLSYISADISSKIAMVKMDITSIPVENNTFDVILCSHVLEHIIDDRKAISELCRVLKPGGRALLQLPILCDKTLDNESIVFSGERERIFGHRDHVRKCGKDYKNRLEEFGFKVKVDDYVKSLGERRIKRYGLRPQENIYFCSK